MRPHVLLVPLFLLFLSPFAKAQEIPRSAGNWVQVTTGQYVIITDAGERRAREMAASIERLAAAVDQATSLTTRSHRPVRIFAFRRPADFSPYRDGILGPGTDKTGVFASRRFVDYILLDTTYPRMEPLLFHELTHGFVRNSFPHAPLWLNEGLAELFGTFEVRRDRVLFGLPDVEAVQLLRGRSPVAMKEMLTMTGTAEQFRQGPRARFIYAQSWAMVHYLLIGNETTRKGFIDYLRLCAAGTPSLEAFQKAFGMTAEAMEKEIFGYVRQSSLPHLTAALKQQEAGTIVVRKLSHSELLAELGTLLLDTTGWGGDRVEHFLRESLRLDAGNAQAHAALGDLLAARGEREAARHHYETALRLDPDNRRAAVATGKASDPSALTTLLVRQFSGEVESADLTKDLRDLRQQTLRDLEAADTPEERARLQRLLVSIEGSLKIGPSAESLYQEAIRLANEQKPGEALERIERILATTQPGSLYHTAATDLKRQVESRRP